MKKQFADAEFQFGLEIALGAAYRQASDVGEALATADRIADGDADSWVNEWTATAEVCQPPAPKPRRPGAASARSRTIGAPRPTTPPRCTRSPAPPTTRPSVSSSCGAASAPVGSGSSICNRCPESASRSRTIERYITSQLSPASFPTATSAFWLTRLW
jgi:hypothetical protein